VKKVNYLRQRKKVLSFWHECTAGDVVERIRGEKNCSGSESDSGGYEKRCSDHEMRLSHSVSFVHIIEQNSCVLPRVGGYTSRVVVSTNRTRKTRHLRFFQRP
jgi:hypothetical protein